jgi:hypothetical protein
VIQFRNTRRGLAERSETAAFESFASAQRISLEPKDDADFRLIRYAEHILASAIGGASWSSCTSKLSKLGHWSPGKGNRPLNN